MGHKRLDRATNEVIREKVRVVGNKMQEERLRQFGDIKRRSLDAHVSMCEMIQIPKYKIGQNRSKKN